MSIIAAQDANAYWAPSRSSSVCAALRSFEGADHAGQGRPERALGAPHVRVQGQAAVARAELLAVQHRVDAFQLVVIILAVGVYRVFDGQELISKLVEDSCGTDGGVDRGELRKAFQLVLAIPGASSTLAAIGSSPPAYISI